MKRAPKEEKIRTKTRQQLAAEYGLHRNTFLRKLKKAPLQLPPGLVYPKDQQKIYEVLGEPVNAPIS